MDRLRCAVCVLQGNGKARQAAWRFHELMLAYYRLSTGGGYDRVITRAIDNRPMSSRGEALFHSTTEKKHVLRQHYLQFSHGSRPSFTLVSGPWVVLENPACVAGRNSPVVGSTVRVQATSRA